MPSTGPDNVVSVAVAVICNGQNQVLLTQRAAHVHKGGCWEFPGGKLEPGESVFTALQREIREELGLLVQRAHPLINIPFQYPEKSVLLQVCRVTVFSGEPRALEGQPMRWQAVSALNELNFPEANRAIIHALQLPARYLITPEPESRDVDRFLQQFEHSLSGVSMAQLRAKNLSQEDYLTLAKKVAPLCEARKVKLLLNTDPALVSQVDAQGVHLTSARLMACQKRPLSSDYWVAASCHNREQLLHAQQIGVDFVVLAPVLATQSHPGAKALGWLQFQELLGISALPVYALGGVKPEHLDQVVQMGGQGIAAISGLWQQ